MKYLLLNCVFAATALFALATTAYTTTFTVTKITDTNDGVCDADCSLREAINAVNSAQAGGNVIVFTGVSFDSQQTMTMQLGHLEVTSPLPLSIQGPGAGLLVLDGRLGDRIFTLRLPTIVTISGLTLTKGGGRAAGNLMGGGAIFNDGALNLNGVNINSSGDIEGNAGSSGGAIYNTGVLSIENCVISGNSSSDGVGGNAGYGGAIFNSAGSSLSILNSRLLNNTALGSYEGGAIYNSDGVSTVIVGATISGNQSNYGGGILNNSGELRISNSTFDGNAHIGNFGGGGAVAHRNGLIYISDSSFTGNSGGGGGAVYIREGAAEIVRSTFSNNSTTQGSGGGLLSGARLTMSDSVFQGNTANPGNNFDGASGGGFFNFGVATVTRSRFVSNLAQFGGGLGSSTGSLTVSESIILSNTATSSGGGITSGGGVFAPSGGQIFINNSTIANNNALTAGGLVTVNQNSTSISSSTIAGNSAQNFGGILNQAIATTRARNTIVGNNRLNSGQPSDVQGVLTSEGHNLIETTTGMSISGSQTGNILGRNPRLVPLRDNGGSTMTFGLQLDSPAIDAGDQNNFPATDQRGVARSQDGDFNGTNLPDIGAYERRLSFLTVNKTTDTNDGACDADCSLREALSAAAVTNEPDKVIDFAPSVFAGPTQITLSGSELVADSGQGTLVVLGPGSNLLNINANNASRAVYVPLTSIAMLKRLTISGGNGIGQVSASWGGGVLNKGNLAVVEAVVRDNSANSNGNGGGIFNEGVGSRLEVIASSVTNNIGNGGGLYNFHGTMGLQNSTVAGNQGSNGGGILNVSGGLTLTGSTVNNNAANGGGEGGGILNIQGSVFLTDSFVTGNSGKSSGGGIRHDEGILNLTRSSVSNNTIVGGTTGAGISIRHGSGIFTNSFVDNNSCSASCSGGGASIFGNLAQYTVTGSSLSGNSSGVGGGIWMENGPTVTINNSQIIGNTGAGGGGGVLVSSGTFSMTNSTVSGNITTQGFAAGGGIQLGTATVNIQSSTIANNRTGSGGGGGIRNGSGTATGSVSIRNTIVGDNSAAGNSSHDISGPIQSQGYNLIENPTGAVITGATVGNITGRDPALVPLRNNGGATLTVALQPTSPAIDTADPANFPSTDQRGVARAKDGNLDGTSRADIGAYERSVAVLTVTEGTDVDDGNCVPTCSLREAVNAVNASASPDNAILFNASFDGASEIVLTAGELSITNGGTLYIRGNGSELLTISGNDSSRVFNVDANAQLTLEGVTVTGGNGVGAQGSGHGGAIRIFNGGTLYMIDSVVRDSHVAGTGTGGGIAVVSGRLFLQGTTISDNSTAGNAGGGIYQTDGIVSIIHSIIRGNVAGGDGGGIWNLGGVLTIERSSISGNSGHDAGGIRSGGAFSLNRSTVNGNSADDGGGGLRLFNSNAVVSNSTISGNSARFNGGGGILANGSTLSIASTTIAFNDANSDNDGSGNGGGIHNGGSSITLRNSIVARNKAANGKDIQGSISSQGFNLIQDVSGSTISGDTTGNILGKDPLLLPLRNNGGPTLTHAIRLTSPALDSGNGSSDIGSDQRAVPRPYDFPSITNPPNGDGSDIGSFERQQTDVVPVTSFDFDGDGKSDVSVYRPSEGKWYIRGSQQGELITSWGASTDRLVPGDYDGDGKTDPAIFRDGVFWIMKSTGGFEAANWGVASDTPAPADYDGDGKTDPAVFRDGVFWILKSTGGVESVNWGVATDVPVPADYDGDGRADPAIFRDGAWWVYKSTGGYQSYFWGVATDRLVPADYDGDGKTDPAIFRDGVFWVYKSGGGSEGINWGIGTDTPVPADYDGDGRTDPAIFREGAFWILKSTGGYEGLPWGVGTDVPVAFRGRP